VGGGRVACICERGGVRLCPFHSPSTMGADHFCHSLHSPILSLPSYSSQSLGGIPGIPRVHYKGRQGDYYVMVRERERR